MVYAISLLLHVKDGQHGFRVQKTVNDAGLEIWLGPLCIIVGCLTPAAPDVATATCAHDFSFPSEGNWFCPDCSCLVPPRR